MTCTTAMLYLHPVIFWMSSCWRTLAPAQGQPRPAPWVLLLTAAARRRVEVVDLLAELVRINFHALFTLIKLKTRSEATHFGLRGIINVQGFLKCPI